MKHHRRVLVINRASAPEMRHLIINLSTKGVRNETMEGRPYKVVPMVMIVEGVANGSMGRLYYPKDELRKGLNLWDHKPIVVYHPTANGEGISACKPDVLTKQKVGVILNTSVDNKGPGGLLRMKAEAWIEAERANLVDPRVAVAINQQKTMELSTGLFMDVEPVENGDFRGNAYDGIARNYRPDHLAILPDKKGACSIKDGAGFIRNELWDDPTAQEIDDGGDDEDEEDLDAREAVIESDNDDDEVDQDNDGEEEDKDTDEAGYNADKDQRGTSKKMLPAALKATKAAIDATNTTDEHLESRGEKANPNVKALATQAGGYAKRAKAAGSPQMAALYHTKAGRTYDKAQTANYRAKGWVKTSIALSKAGSAHYAAADAHKGVANAMLIENGGPGSGRYPKGSTESMKTSTLGRAADKATEKAKKSGDSLDYSNAKYLHGKAAARHYDSTQEGNQSDKYMHHLIMEHRARVWLQTNAPHMQINDATNPGEYDGHGADGQDASIAATSIGVTKFNPSVMKKKKGKIEQKISVMQERLLLLTAPAKEKYKYAIQNSFEDTGVMSGSLTKKMAKGKNGRTKEDPNEGSGKPTVGNASKTCKDCTDAAHKATKMANAAGTRDMHMKASQAHANAEDAYDKSDDTSKQNQRMSSYHGDMASQHLSSARYTRNCAKVRTLEFV